MRKLLLASLLLFLFGCTIDTYLFNEGDKVLVDKKISLHPEFKERKMKKFIDETVTVTLRVQSQSGNAYKIAEDGGYNYWPEAFLKLVEEGMISKLKKEEKEWESNTLVLGIVETTKAVTKEFKTKAEDEQDTSVATVETKVDSIEESFYLPKDKVYWFWKLYEKAENNGSHSDWFQVWEYVEKYIPEVDKYPGFHIDNKGSSPRIWRKVPVAK